MSFRVAILGDLDPVSSPDSMFFGMGVCYGIQVFDLSADQICSILQSPDHSKGVDVAKIGAEPVSKYQIYTGGRFFPSVNREEIVQVMEGVSVTLMMTSNSPYDLDYNKVQFYEYLTNELLDRCKAVVLKVYAMDKKIHLYGKQKPSTIDDILKTAHLSKATSIKHKLYIVADEEVKQKRKSKSKSKSKKNKSGQEMDKVAVVSQLRACLLGEEVKIAVTAPMKETVSAGKSLINMGQRFSSWVTSIIKS